MGRRPDMTDQILARLAEQDARFARLEALLRELISSRGEYGTLDVHLPPELSLESSSLPIDADDPFVPPDWKRDAETGIYTYTIETECCQHCGKSFYPENHWTWRDNDDNTIPSFDKNGTKPLLFHDIGPREIRIRRKEYRCKIHSCFRTTRQKLPDIFQPGRRMTQRLYSLIVTELKKKAYSGQLTTIAEKAGVSIKTIRRIREEISG